MTKKQKLELTWIGKNKRPKLEARILLEDTEKSYHAQVRAEGALFDNRLIFGDNLLALKALEQEFAGKVKCVFIDPPYNTGSAFAHYDDGLEHSIWLGLMRDRLEIIKRLLSEDGSLWITIDDNEAHYLKVLCDEVFGRGSFIASNVWQKRYSRENREAIGDSHDYILVYAMNPIRFKEQRNLVPMNEQQAKVYRNPNNDPRGRWRPIPMTAQAGHATSEQFYEVVTPSGAVHVPPEGRCWGIAKSTYERLLSEGRIYFGKDGSAQPNIIRYLDEVPGVAPWTWWPHEEVGHTDESKKEMHALFGKTDPFLTPKPERLLQRIIHIATNPGDLVLDSFAGSGTTGAVAHKMGRRWIMVELGEHCHTHIIPRLQKVIDGTDQGGISKAVNWQGGGGFRYYRLAPTLIVNDAWSNPVINPEYNAAQLAEALAKLEGFTYQPSETLWWQHGYSSERDFIYVTTQTLSAEQLQALSDEVGERQSLLVCCAAWRGMTAAQAAERFPNLSLKKIPKMVLARCEWGHDDYSLNVANLPLAEPECLSENQAAAKEKTAKRKSAVKNQGVLFTGEDGDE
ncbi:site-specific DNA-methyltransferase [Basfia succiniciproducens]|uniref:site-specific DNA-methyltransferase n=1 Tax=Basfia succiniciproducens TaxID=653940 RepID=UPI0008AD8428|nr:site-specific DNA-methyltransferase [Basfia succiniciproducens]SEP97952.1 adenine-specific DNA-methyltransferase [Basfia succiniciproducens]